MFKLTQTQQDTEKKHKLVQKRRIWGAFFLFCFFVVVLRPTQLFWKSTLIQSSTIRTLPPPMEWKSIMGTSSSSSSSAKQIHFRRMWHAGMKDYMIQNTAENCWKVSGLTLASHRIHGNNTGGFVCVCVRLCASLKGKAVHRHPVYT